MLSVLSNPSVMLAIAAILLYLIWKWAYPKKKQYLVGLDDDREMALGSGPPQPVHGLIGAAQRPTIHPNNTQTIHRTTGKVSNSTMDAVTTIKGTGLFNGVQIKPRQRHALQRINPQDILAATTRPRGTPTPGVYKKNSNRQIRPEPAIKEGVGILPTVSTLKDIKHREVFSPLFSQTIAGADFDI